MVSCPRPRVVFTLPDQDSMFVTKGLIPPRFKCVEVVQSGKQKDRCLILLCLALERYRERERENERAKQETLVLFIRRIFICSRSDIKGRPRRPCDHFTSNSCDTLTLKLSLV